MVSKFDCVILFDEQDVFSAKLLLRSIEKHCPNELINNIFFINNSRDAARGALLFDAIVREELTTTPSRIKLVSPEVIGITGACLTSTDVMRQFLRLSCASLVTTSHYLVLDPELHFLRDVGPEDFFSSDGRVWTEYQQYSGFVKTCLDSTFELFGLPIDPVYTGLPHIAPTLIVTGAARKLLDTLKCEVMGRRLVQLSTKRKLLDLIVYYAFLRMTNDFDCQYARGRRRYARIFNQYPQGSQMIGDVIKRGSDPEIYCFAIARSRFSDLDPENIERLLRLWNDGGLLTRADALGLIENQCALACGEDVHRIAGVKLPKVAGDQKVRYSGSGRLYIDNDTNAVVAMHTGKAPLGKLMLDAWRRLLTQRHELAHATDFTYLMTIAPDSHALYSEPFRVAAGDAQRPVEQLLATLEHAICPLYLLRSLVRAQQSGEPIHPSDSHWSSFGAFHAFKEIVTHLSLLDPLGESSAVRIFPMYGVGDLGSKFDPPIAGSYTECLLASPMSTPRWNNGITNRGRMDLWVNKNTRLPSAVLLTDSYGWKIQPFLAQCFSWLFVVHSPNLEMEAIRKYRPDFVIQLMAERFLPHVPDDARDLTALHHSTKKGGNASYLDFEQMLGVGLKGGGH